MTSGGCADGGGKGGLVRGKVVATDLPTCTSAAPQRARVLDYFAMSEDWFGGGVIQRPHLEDGWSFQPHGGIAMSIAGKSQNPTVDR